MTTKGRFSATVEPELLEAGRAAVAAGRAPSLSAWVNEALSRQVEHERRLAALDDYLAAYESAHGAFSDDELVEAEQRLQERAVWAGPVDAPRERPGRRRTGRRGAA